MRVGSLADAESVVGGIQDVVRFTQTSREDHVEVDVVLADENALTQVLSAIQESGGHLLSLEKREASLEDVFLRVVGHGFEEAEEQGS